MITIIVAQASAMGKPNGPVCQVQSLCSSNHLAVPGSKALPALLGVTQA